MLQTNYASGPDAEYLMISSPRVLEYELLILEYAVDLLEYYGKDQLFKRATLEEDQNRIDAVVDYRLKTVLSYNV